MYGSYYEHISSFENKDIFVKENLINMGFNFSMLGSMYIKEMIHEVIKHPQMLHCICTNLIEHVAKTHKKSAKSISSDISWAIKSAFSKNVLKSVPCFNNYSTPSTKQVLTFLYDFFTC